MQSQSDNAVVAVAPPPPPSWRRASTVRLTIPRSICRTLSCIGWRKTVTTICRDGDGITPSSYTAGGIYRSVSWLYQNNIVVRCLYVRCVCWTCKLLTTCCTNSLNIYSSLFTITVSMQPADSITYCCIILSYIWQAWNNETVTDELWTYLFTNSVVEFFKNENTNTDYIIRGTGTYLHQGTVHYSHLNGNAPGSKKSAFIVKLGLYIHLYSPSRCK